MSGVCFFLVVFFLFEASFWGVKISMGDEISITPGISPKCLSTSGIPLGLAFRDTPLKINIFNMEHNHRGLIQIIFLSK